MKILIVGAGGREHALAWKCQQSKKVSGVFVTPGNDGIAIDADCWHLTDHQLIVEKAKDHKIDMAIIGQEDYLVKGLKEQLEAAGIKVIGPGKKAARLEGSKVFAKQFMERHGIPTATFQVFDEYTSTVQFLSHQTYPIVIKADGLAAGKGVQVCKDFTSAQRWLEQLMVKGKYGEAGQTVVIEEFIEGKEISWFVISDELSQKEFIPLQDYKKQFDGGKGPNTGGMGCYAPVPFIDQSMAESIRQSIITPTFSGLKSEGIPYQGVLYFGLMISTKGPILLEYNVRFGDPECQTLMSLLESDLIDLLEAVADKTLSQQTLQWKNGSAVTVILASENYPEGGTVPRSIQGLEALENQSSSKAFHAATALKGSQFYTNGGRVLGLTATGSTLESARHHSYRMAENIFWEGVQFRRDIACEQNS